MEGHRLPSTFFFSAKDICTINFTFFNLYLHLYYVAASPKIQVPVTAAIIRFDHNPCYTAYNTETFKRESTFCKFKYTILSKGYKESHFYKLTVIVGNEPYTDQLYLQKSTWLLFTFVYFDTTVS